MTVLQENVNVAGVHVFLLESPKYMANFASVMIDSVKTMMAMSAMVGQF